MSYANETFSNCRGVLRSVQFAYGEFEGQKYPQLVCRFGIVEGDETGKNETWFATLSNDLDKNGTPRYEHTVKSLRACGWDGVDVSELPALIERGLVSKTVDLVRSHTVDKNGKPQTKIKYVNGAGVSLKNEMTAAEIATLARQLKAQLSPASPVNRTAAPPPKQTYMSSYAMESAPPPTDNDLPF